MTYSINGSVSSLLQSDSAAFAPLLKKVVSDIHLLLTDYDIQDRATLISVLSAKLATQELNGEIDEALQTIGALRALQQKPDLKLTIGLFDEAILKAKQRTNGGAGPAYERAVESIYKEAVSALPWGVVQDSVKSARNTSTLLTEAFLLGKAQEDLQPICMNSRNGWPAQRPARTPIKEKKKPPNFLPSGSRRFTTLSKVCPTPCLSRQPETLIATQDFCRMSRLLWSFLTL